MDTFEKSKKAIGNYPHNNIIYVPLKNMVPEEGLTWIEWSNVVLNSIEIMRLRDFQNILYIDLLFLK